MTSHQFNPLLPGNRSHEEDIKRMIRVNHAGEYGAKRIYAGQISVLGKSHLGPTLKHMAEQEEVHLDYFEKEMVKRQVRPTVLQPLWHMAGYALGAATALLGEKAAMACTVAVEEVIDAHYQEQLNKLNHTGEETELSHSIRQFQAEELEHRNIGIAHHAEQAPGYALLSHAIKTGSKLAIWLSTRF
ncbi:MAG: demethoxyubiquinone hydroxylase family protein [Alphaproteobacteria bacterium]|nr:demethoxyubiquinone hydroxylase family protein [Alphaproteobacteria bacterium]